MTDISVQEDMFGSVDEHNSDNSDDDIVNEDNSDNSDDDMSVTSKKSSDIDPGESIVDETFDMCQSQYEAEVNKLMEEDSDISETEARENVFEDMKNTYMKAMMNIFGGKLVWFETMKKDPIYKAIKKTVNQLIAAENYEGEEALKYAILKRRFLFDKVLDNHVTPQLEDEEDTEQMEDTE